MKYFIFFIFLITLYSLSYVLMNNFYSCDVLGENVFNFTDYYGRMNMYDLKNFTASFNFSYTENLNITNCSFKK